MSPTKPIAPAVVTAAAVRSAERANRSHGRRATSTPSAAAVASPRANALRSRANGNAAVSASASAPSVDHATGGAERSPISQNSMPRSCASGAIDRMSATRAPHPAAITTPVSRSRVGDHAPTPRARPNTSSVEASAPPNAPAETSHAAAPASIIDSAPTAAPPETPST